MPWSGDDAAEFEDAYGKRDYLKLGEFLSKRGKEMVESGYMDDAALKEGKAKVSARLKEQMGMPAKPDISTMDRIRMSASSPLHLGLTGIIQPPETKEQVAANPSPAGRVGSAMVNQAHHVEGMAPYFAAGLAGGAIGGPPGAIAAPLALMGGQAVGALGNYLTGRQGGEEAATSVNPAAPFVNLYSNAQKEGTAEALKRAAIEGDLLDMGMIGHGIAKSGKIAEMGRRLLGPKEAAARAPGEPPPAAPGQPADLAKRLQDIHAQVLDLPESDPLRREAASLDVQHLEHAATGHGSPVTEAQIAALEAKVRGESATPSEGPPTSLADAGRQQLQRQADAEENPQWRQDAAEREKLTAQYQKLTADYKAARDRGDFKAARGIRSGLQLVRSDLAKLEPAPPMQPGQELGTRTMPAGTADYSQIGYTPADRFLDQLPEPQRQERLRQEVGMVQGQEQGRINQANAAAAPRMAENQRLSNVRAALLANPDQSPMGAGRFFRSGREPAQPQVRQPMPEAYASEGPKLSPFTMDQEGLDRFNVGQAGVGTTNSGAHVALGAPKARGIDIGEALKQERPPEQPMDREIPVKPEQPKRSPLKMTQEEIDRMNVGASGTPTRNSAESVRLGGDRAPAADTFHNRVFGKKKALIATALAAGGAYSYLSASDEEKEKMRSGLAMAAAVPLGIGGLREAAEKAMTPLETPLTVAPHPTGTEAMLNAKYGSSVAHSAIYESMGVADAALEVGARIHDLERSALDQLGGHEQFDQLRAWMREKPPEVWRYIKKTIQQRPVTPEESIAALTNPDAKKILAVRDALREIYPALAKALQVENPRENYYPNTEPEIGRKTLALQNEGILREGELAKGEAPVKRRDRRTYLDEGSLEHRREFENFDPNESPLDTFHRYLNDAKNRVINRTFIEPLSVLERRLRAAKQIVGADAVSDYIDNTLHHQSGLVDQMIRRSTLHKVAENAGKIKVGDEIPWDGSMGLPAGKVKVIEDGGQGTAGHNFYVEVNGKRWPARMTAEQLAFMDLQNKGMGWRQVDNPAAKVVGSLTRLMSLHYIWGNFRTFASAMTFENPVRMLTGPVDPFSEKGASQMARGAASSIEVMKSALGDRKLLNGVLEQMERFGLVESGRVRLDNDAPTFNRLAQIADHPAVKWPLALGYLNVSSPDFVSKVGILMTNLHAMADAHGGMPKGGILEAPEAWWRKAAKETFKTSDAHHRYLQTPGSKNGAYQLISYLKKAPGRSAAHLAELAGEAVKGGLSLKGKKRLAIWLGTYAGLGAATIKAFHLDTDEGIDLFSRWFPFGDVLIKSRLQAAGIAHGDPEKSEQVTNVPAYDFLTHYTPFVGDEWLRGMAEAHAAGGLPTVKQMTKMVPGFPEPARRTLADWTQYLASQDPEAAQSAKRRLFVSPSMKDRSPPWDIDADKRARLAEARKEQRDAAK